MVDYLSRYRLYGLGYTLVPPRRSVPSYSELYKSTAPYTFKSGQTPTHDCRLDILKEHTDRRDWETQLLCNGLRQTCSDLGNLRQEQKKDETTKRKDKLLFNLGIRGSGDGDFCYPRGLTITDRGDLVIADTMNHRLQVLNQYGVFKFSFGKKGQTDGEFNQPTAVAMMPNDDIAVSDSKNRRIQIFHQTGKFNYSFPTRDVPYSVACDHNYNIVVGTTTKSAEVYSREGNLLETFKTHVTTKRPKSIVPVFVTCNGRGEIVLLDPEERRVKFYSISGNLIRKFPLQLCNGLTMAPSSVCLGSNDQIIVGDSLNHTVTLYSERGELLAQVLGPADGVGPVQSCQLAPEGHLALSEFSVTGEHCVKIFRFRDCVCHLSRPGSSKRRTMTSSPTKEVTASLLNGP